MRRRRLLTLAAAGPLAACGFQPVYMPTASGTAGVAQRELAAIRVNLIPDRPGQLLRQALQARLEGSGEGVARRYDLTVGFSISGEGLAIQEDNTVTRIRTIGSANWALFTQIPPRTRLSSGTAQTVDGLNLISSQYFAADLENETVQRRMAETLADQIILQLTAYFRQRAAAAAAAQG